MIERRDWSQLAEVELAEAAGSSADLAAVRAEVLQGKAQLWQISGPSRGWMVTRVEQDCAGQLELVIVLGAGRNCRPVIEWAEGLALSHGIMQLRTHITRAGLQRIYEKKGWEPEQLVMRKRLNGQSQQQ